MIRVLVLMTLLPGADAREAVIALAGDLGMVPWARAWAPASPRALRDWRNALGPGPLEELQAIVLGASWQEHQDRDWRAVIIGRARPLKTGSLDGTLIRVPDTPANRAAFGSTGTSDDSSPFPQVRALPLTDASTRALFGMPYGPAGTDKAAAEQKLLDTAMEQYPHLFTMDRVWLMDRNYPGAARIARLASRTHVLIRLKSDIPLKMVSGILADGSYLAEISGDGATVTVRVIEYWVTVEGQDVPEMFCLVTDLMDITEHPAAELAALYKWRFLSALGASAGVGVSSARAGAGCRNVAAAVGSVSHRRIGVVKRVCRKSPLRGARRSRDACASRVPGCEEGPAVAVGGPSDLDA